MKQSMRKNGLFSPSCFTTAREAESTLGKVTRRFAPWRLYTSAECASLFEIMNLTKCEKCYLSFSLL